MTLQQLIIFLGYW